MLFDNLKPMTTHELGQKMRREMLNRSPLLPVDPSIFPKKNNYLLQNVPVIDLRKPKKLKSFYGLPYPADPYMQKSLDKERKDLEMSIEMEKFRSKHKLYFP